MLEKFTKNKGREIGFSRWVYGRFLIKRIITSATMMIRANRPAIAGRKYCSTVDGAAVGAGLAVGAASMTLNAVVAVDGQ